MNQRYSVADLNTILPVDCPCGQTRRAFIGDADQVASLHVVETCGAARVHYHKKTTEIYYFLSGKGQLELDGELIAVRQGMSVLIKPGCRHRAVGELTFINVPIPAFDPHDEWFDDE